MQTAVLLIKMLFTIIIAAALTIILIVEWESLGNQYVVLEALPSVYLFSARVGFALGIGLMIYGSADYLKALRER